ncbi:MAG: S8 family serine peptidase [Phycisphaerales bacterium]|nr:S8 family serine peptidase [Phycisphaerales bacterium]
MRAAHSHQYARVLGLLLVTVASAQSATGESFHYSYFKEHIALELDTTRVAIFADAQVDAGQRAARFHVPADEVVALPIPGAFVASLAEASRSVDGVHSRVAALLQDESVSLAAPVFLDAYGEPMIVSRNVLVGFDAEMDPTTSRAILRAHLQANDRVERWTSLAHAYRVHCATRDGFEVLALANRLAELPEVSFAEPDMLATARATEIPNDPMFGDQWALHNTGQSGGTADIDMDIPEAREYTTGDSGILIAVLDNGMQLNHPDLGTVTGVDFTGSGTAGGPGNACDNHATLIAGTIRAIANNSIGVVGVAPNCTLVSVKYGVSTVPCNGNGTYMTSWLVDAIDWCANNGVRITNNSNGLSSQSSITSKYLETYNAGVVHFASSGNVASPIVSYPASLSSVIAVGAVDRTGTRAFFSNYGTGLALMAPGVAIPTTDRSGSDGQDPGDYDTVDGTSFAAPYAAAVAGLVLSVDPTLTPAEVESILRSTARDLGNPGYDTQYGDGLVQAQAAVEAAGARIPAGTFADCLAGPQVSTPPVSCSDMQFDLCDIDADNDVDLRDFSHYTK